MKFNTLVSTQESIREDYAPSLSQEEDMAFRTSPGAVLEDGVADMQQSCRDIDEIDGAIQDGVSSIDRLDDLQAVVLESPELEDKQLGLIQATHESIMSHLGLSSVYTAESLRVGSVVATLEEAKNGIWQGIVTMLKKLGETVMSFLAGFLKNTYMLSKYLKFLESRVNDIKDGPSEKTMPLVKAIAHKGNADFSSANSIAKDAILMTDLALKTVGVMQQFQGTFKRTISKSAVEHAYNHEKGIDNPEDAVIFDEKEIGLNNFPVDSSGDGHGVGALSGNRQFKSNYVNFDAEARIASRPVPKSSEVLTQGEMKSLLSDASKIIDGIKKVESKKSIIKSIMNSIMTVSAELVDMVKIGKAQKKATAFQTGLYRRMVIRMTKSYLGEAFRSAKALLDYVKVCLKYYTFTKETDSKSEETFVPGEAKRLTGSEKIHKVDWELA